MHTRGGGAANISGNQGPDQKYPATIVNKYWFIICFFYRISDSI